MTWPLPVRYCTLLSATTLLVTFPVRITYPTRRRQHYSHNNVSTAIIELLSIRMELELRYWQSCSFSALLHARSSDCSVIVKATALTLTQSRVTCRPYFSAHFSFLICEREVAFHLQKWLHESLDHLQCCGRGGCSPYVHIILKVVPEKEPCSK